MASGSRVENQNDTESRGPVDLLSEQSNDAAAAAAATEPPPLAQQSEITEDGVHGPPEAGGRDREAYAATAAAAEQKGEDTMSLFGRGSEGGESSLPPRTLSVSAARGTNYAGGRAPRPMSGVEGMASGMERRTKPKRKDVFHELMLELQRSGETDLNAEGDGMPRQQNEQVMSPTVWHENVIKKSLWTKAIVPAMMASGSGKNQDDNETKELVDLLSEVNSNMATSTTELSPSAVPFKGHGPLEAGDRDSSTRTAAVAEWKGQGEETVVLSRQGSTCAKPPLPPCPASIPRARGVNIDMNDTFNEQKKNEDATFGVRTSSRRRINCRQIFIITILIFLGYLPTTIGFQRYDPNAATNELRAPQYQVQIQQMLAAQEAQEAARLKVLWRTSAIVLLLAFLFGNIMGAANHGQEEVVPPEALAPDIRRGSDLLIVVLILFALVMVTVAIRVVLRG